MRVARLVLFVVFVLGLVMLLAGAVARTYLTSPQAATQASAVLSKAYGAHVRVSAADINLNATAVSGVREKWPLPRIIEGRLTGQANLVVTVIQGKTKTTGQGEGEVMGVPVGFGKKATIPLKLSADDHGFHFVPRWPKTGFVPITPAADVTN
jgi:hypothetical protein